SFETTPRPLSSNRSKRSIDQSHESLSLWTNELRGGGSQAWHGSSKRQAMTRVAILTPTLTSADAVSNDVLGMRNLLVGCGHDACIFADSTNLPGEQIQPPAAAASYLRGAEDVLIYHHSIGWDEGIERLKAASCRRIVKYHNVTPPEFFENISQQHQNLCRRGLSQIKEIIAVRPDLYL